MSSTNRMGIIFDNYGAISLHTSSWPGRIPLTPELVNLENDPVITSVMRLGSLSALPEDATKEINAAYNDAREYLRINSVRFAKLPGVRLVQLDKMQELVEKLRGHRDLVEKAVANYEAKFPEYVKSHRPTIEAGLFKALKLDKLDTDSPEFMRGVNALGDLMAYIDGAYPTPREAAAKFRLYWSSPFKIDRAKDGVDAESAAAEVEEVKSVLQGVTEELRAELVKCVVEPVKRLLAKDGKITKRTTNAARDAIARIRSLNIIGDTTLTFALDQAELWCNRIDSDAPGAVMNGLAAGFDEIEQLAQIDIETAVEQAEAALTAVGRRRIQIITPEEEAA